LPDNESNLVQTKYSMSILPQKLVQFQIPMDVQF
jgi:hypothetical protein